ncbi:MAG: BamA/TamA family outer membrane protein [bacterium]|nr:BamA/TamA family outer membrane protein [bacterium]
MNFNRTPILCLILVVSVFTVTKAQKIPREFVAVDGYPIQKVIIKDCPLPSSQIWEKVYTAPDKWYQKILFWRKPQIFNAAEFTRDLIRVQRILIREGWRNPKVQGTVTLTPKDKLIVIYQVQVGAYTKVRNYWLNANELNKKDTTRFRRYISLAKERRFREVELYQAADSLRLLYTRRGYGKAIIVPKVDWIGDDSLYVDINFLVNAGPYCVFDSAYVYGVSRLSAKDVTSDVFTKYGKEFSSIDIEKSRRVLYSRSLFQSVDIIADTSVPSNRIPIRIRVMEANRWQTRVGGGWSTDEGYKGFGEITDRFLLTGARTIKVGAIASKRIQELNLTITQPHPVGAGSQFSISPYIQNRKEQNWELRKLGSTQNLSFYSGQWWTIQLIQKLQQSDLSGKVPLISVGQDQYNLDQYAISGIYDFRDDKFDPTQGGIVSPEISLSGVFFPSTYRFYKGKVFGNYFITFDKKLTYAARFESGILVPTRKDGEIPIDERFFLGDPGLLRGWKRRSLSPRDSNQTYIGGQAMMASSFEIRQKIWGPLWLATFFDAGMVWKNYTDYGKFPLQTSTGIGMRLRTPIGPIRMDVGWKTRKNPFHESMKPVLHIAIGEAL